MGRNRQPNVDHPRDRRSPAGSAVNDRLGLYRSATCLDADDPTVMAVDRGDLGLGVEVNAEAIRAPGIAPDDGVVADNATGRMEERRLDRIARAIAQVERRDELLDLVGPDEAAV